MKTRRNFKPKFCVICGQHFELEEGDNVSRVVCYRIDCIKKFRFFCGAGNRFWQSPEFKKKMARRQEEYLQGYKERNNIEVQQEI